MNSIQSLLNKKGLRGEFSNRLVESECIFTDIYKECDSSFIRGDGSYLFLGAEYEYCPEMYEKQELLYNLAKSTESVLEIGTYMGHSLLIMLLANPKLRIASVDINDKYAVPAIKVLKRYFPEADITFFHGNSIEVLPTITHLQFGLFHIDGQHLESHIEQEVESCRKMSNFVYDGKKAMKIVFDDLHCCEGFVNKIEQNSTVIRRITPSCIWKNSYIEFLEK